MNARVRAGFASATFLLGLLGVTGPATATPAVAADNPVVVENQQTGTSAWQLGSLVATDAGGQIKGYASATSVTQGSSLNVYVSVNPAQTFTIDVYRIGWYGGLGGRLRLHDGPITGATQSACPADATTGAISCNWTSSYTLAVGTDWTSGVYLAVLTNAAGYQNDVQFVVRDGRAAAYLYQVAVNTYQAFNNYPNDKATGKSLFSFNSYGASTVSGGPQAVKVSFDRPYADDGSGGIFGETNFIRWAEKSGYDITYATDVDTHANGPELLNHKAFLTAGHDEFWSKEMYDAAQNARDGGVNLGFFNANDIFWQVRFEASAAGVANRVMVCYRYASIDPVFGPTTTVMWRAAPVNRPEQLLMGVQYTSEANWGTTVPYVVTNSSNWAYNGTGVKDGDAVPGVVGYQMDRYMPDVPAPAWTSQTLLSQSPFTNSGGAADYANSSIYQAPSGAFVFAAGTSSWGGALDNFGLSTPTDARIQQTTANVLTGFLTSQIVKDLKVTAPATATAGQAFSVTVVAENVQGTPVTSYGGTVHFTSSDAGATVPADARLINGQGTFSVTLITAGAQTLTVSDAANGFSTTATATVMAAPASKLTLSTPSGSQTAGQSFVVALKALDPYGNIDTNYAGKVHFTSTDRSTSASLPPDSTLTSGQGNVSATLTTAGSQTITGTDTATVSITGTLTVQVTPGAAAAVRITAPAAAKVNEPFMITVTVADRFGNTATGYRGTVHFSSSDVLASTLGKLPADYAFTAADAGTHGFGAALMTPPSQTITVADTVNASLTATTPSIAVSAV